MKKNPPPQSVPQADDDTTNSAMAPRRDLGPSLPALNPPVATFLKSFTPIQVSIPAVSVLDLFLNHAEILVVPVVDGTLPAGLVYRSGLIESFSRPFMRDLHGRTPISTFMEPNPLIVEDDTTLDELSRRIVERGLRQIVDGYIITRGGEYLGLGLGRDLLQELTERKQAHLHQLAHYDALTGLANRLLFEQRVDQIHGQAARDGRGFGLIYIDVDRFKTINDTFGHNGGDIILREVAQRLLASIRSTDLAARIGGDEFTVVLSQIPDLETAARVAAKIKESMQEPIAVNGELIVITLSMGVAHCADPTTNVKDLLKQADDALYTAKKMGRDNYQIHSTSTLPHANDSIRLDRELRQALASHQLEVWYQPIVRLADRQIVAVEALARWHHPTEGMLSPGRFIPIAEETGLIDSLGTWVLGTAVQDYRALLDAQLISQDSFHLCVNVSSRQLFRPDFADKAVAMLQRHALRASILTLELTESVFMRRTSGAIRTIESLSDAGVKLAIDDFGTGFSSLAYLRDLPVDTLKIDRSFVNEIGIGDNGGSIAATIVAMARHMQLNVVAEGVETDLQAAYLNDHGCSLGQGFLFAHPAPIDQLRDHLRVAVGPAPATR